MLRISGAALALTLAPGCVLIGYGDNDGGAAAPAPKDERRLAAPDGSLQGEAKRGDASMADPRDAPTQTISCGEGDTCTPECESEYCAVDCVASDICYVGCAEGSHCTVDCSQGGVCDMNCAAGATCHMECQDARDCDHLECAEGASCIVHCADNLLGCSLRCHGVSMNCPGGIEVCDAPCPVGAI